MSYGPVKKITNHATPSFNNKVLKELQEVAKTIVETHQALVHNAERPLQAKDSPYLKDRPFFNDQIRYHSDFETSWKNVKTAEESAQNVANWQKLKKLNIF